MLFCKILKWPHPSVIRALRELWNLQHVKWVVFSGMAFHSLVRKVLASPLWHGIGERPGHNDGLHGISHGDQFLKTFSLTRSQENSFHRHPGPNLQCACAPPHTLHNILLKCLLLCATIVLDLGTEKISRSFRLIHGHIYRWHRIWLRMSLFSWDFDHYLDLQSTRYNLEYWLSGMILPWESLSI